MTKLLFYCYLAFFIISCVGSTRTYQKKIKPFYYPQPMTENNFVYVKDTIQENRIEFSHKFNSEIVMDFPRIKSVSKFDKDSNVLIINDVVLKMPNQSDIPDLIPSEIGFLTYKDCNYLYIAEEYFSFIKVYGWSYIFIKLSQTGYSILGVKQLSDQPKDLKTLIDDLSRGRLELIR